MHRITSRRSKRPLAARLAPALLFAGLAMAASATHAQTAPQTDDEKAFYTIGVSIAARLDGLKPISDRELDLVIQGLQDRVEGRALATKPSENRKQVSALLETRRKRAIAAEKEASAAFVAEQSAREGARQTESGLVYTELEAGSGESPGPTDRVQVHYHGTLRDGTVFDSSVSRGEPAEFPLNRVIDCWTEGVTMMKVGGKARLVCPADIAYGDRGFQGRVPPGAALLFEVELLDIKE